MENVLDLVIIGAGPGGIAAGIYASRAMMNFVLLEKFLPGGEIANTYEVDNYPGIAHVTGMELTTLMVNHAESLGVKFTTDEVKELDLSGKIKKVVCYDKTYYTKTVIIATGAKSRPLDAIGTETFFGKGISYCATCDGALYKGKVTAVVGGGDVAVEDAIYLARMCPKVYLIHRRDELRAAKVLQERLFATPNVEIIWDSVALEVTGNDFVEGLTIQNKKNGEIRKLEVSGIFVAVGMTPNSKMVEGQVELAEGGWIVTDDDCETSVKGVFAAGDVRKKSLRQVVTSVSDGATSVFGCERYL
ncbi:MAG: thioredoxin-disulfide reductase [Tenericutes bacterium HGW-Tenericutes-1]|jgi:thioredoxin reductase (NADPH)|nr:MAG: thioredoxin-disulfide reductase [Tenericutes bacterium HGW-Tenericutes-1]